jgi:hypothetical protein
MLDIAMHRRRAAQLDLDQAARQPSSIYRGIELLHEVWLAADMVLMAMCAQHCAHQVLLVLKVGSVRQHKVNSERGCFGEHHPYVDDQHIAPILHADHVLAYLTEPTQGHDA